MSDFEFYNKILPILIKLNFDDPELWALYNYVSSIDPENITEDQYDYLFKCYHGNAFYKYRHLYHTDIIAWRTQEALRMHFGYVYSFYWDKEGTYRDYKCGSAYTACRSIYKHYTNKYNRDIL